MHKTVPIRLSAGFQPRSCSLEGSGMIKINEKYTANQEYYIQQNYPLKKKKKDFPKQKMKKFIITGSGLYEMLKEVLQVKAKGQ